MALVFICFCIIINMIIVIPMYVQEVCVRIHAMACVWGSEDNMDSLHVDSLLSALWRLQESNSGYQL